MSSSAWLPRASAAASRPAARTVGSRADKASNARLARSTTSPTGGSVAASGVAVGVVVAGLGEFMISSKRVRPGCRLQGRSSGWSEGETGGEGVGGVEQVAGCSGDPGAPGDGRDDGRSAGHVGLGDQAAHEAAADERLVDEIRLERQFTA